MAFVNFSLLLGGALVAIPVVLHLMMRQRPKQLFFPALRFVHERRQANQRRLQLRHWLLLALRCSAIAFLALALARPSVASGAISSWMAAGLLIGFCALATMAAVLSAARGVSRFVTGGIATVAAGLLLAALFVGVRAIAGKSPGVGDQEAPVAAAIVFDTSPRMQYRSENKTRLEAAQEISQWLIRQLPAESELAIVDSHSGSGAFAVDRAAAEKAIERLRTSGTPRPLVETIAASVALVKQKSQLRHEVYVLSDLTTSAWKAAAGTDLKKLLAANPKVLIYVIDVGVEKPRNFALSELTLSGDVVPVGGEVTIETQLSASGTGGDRTVELWVEQIDPTLPIIRDGKPVLPKADLRVSRSVKLTPGSSEKVQFKLSGTVGDAKLRADSRLGLAPGVHQGWVRLVGQDGLALDDVRYFAFEVQPAWPILLVSPREVSPRYLSEALAPLELRESGRASFRCDYVEQDRLGNQNLSDYRSIAILDPAPLPAEVWKKLADYCESGGGLAIFLGSHAQQVASFQDPAAAKVLGGKLTRQTRTGGDIYLAPRSYEHPILAGFRQISTSVPWDLFPIFYHWNLDDLAPTARTVIPYGDGKPAVVENRLGRGSVLVMTTPISDPPGRASWNELATGEGAWPCFGLVYEMMQSLVRTSQARLNVLAGETVVLPNDPAEYPDRYQLFTPLEQPQDVFASGGRLTIRFTEHPGAYRLRGQRTGPMVRGFAVNLAGDTSDLSRLPREQLDDCLGRSRYQIAKSRDEINRAVGADRIGSEFYPLLVTLLALTLGLEHLLANRFYRRND